MLLDLYSWLIVEAVLGLEVVVDKDLLEQVGVKFCLWVSLNFLRWSCLLSQRIELTNHGWAS